VTPRAPLVPLALALALALAACGRDGAAAAPYDPTTIEARIPRVLRALRGGDPEAALAALDEREQAGTLPEGAGHYRAIALADSGRLEEAVRAFEHELERHPGNGRAHALLADVLLELGRLDDVPRHLEQARRYAPNLSSLPLISGRAALLAGDDLAAQRHFRDALLADPFGPAAAEAHHALAQIAARRGEDGRERARMHSSASAYLEEVHAYMDAYAARLREDPKDLEAAFGLAAARVNMAVRFGGEAPLIQRAEAALHDVLEIAPDHPRAIFNLAFLRTMQGREDEAHDLYLRATQLDPDYGKAHKNLAHSLELRGDPDAAIASYHRAIASLADPGERAECHLALAAIDEERGDLRGALDQLRRALSLLPEEPPELVERIARLEVRLAALKSGSEADREDG